MEEDWLKPNYIYINCQVQDKTLKGQTKLINKGLFKKLGIIAISNSYAACVTFACVIAGGKTPDVGSRTYTEIMREQLLRGEETEVSKIRMLLILRYSNNHESHLFKYCI